MSEPSSSAPLSRHASWVALRTLRQRPKATGDSYHGEPVFELRSVRMILRDDAGHFDRLVECSKCGRDMPGGPMLAPADLDRAPHRVICRECVRGAAMPPSPISERRPHDQPATAVEAPQPAKVAPPVATPALDAQRDDGRLASLEGGLKTAMARVTELAEAQRSASTERQREQDSSRSSMREALLEGFNQVRAEVKTTLDTGAIRTAKLEDDLRQSLARVGELLEAQRGEIAAVSGALAETRNEMLAVAEYQRELARAQQELDRRMEEVAARPDSGRSAEAASEGLDRRMDEAYERLAEAVAAQGAKLQASLAEGLARAQADVSGLERQLQGSLGALAEVVETQRADLSATLQNGVRHELATVARAVDELGGLARQLEDRINDLASRVDAPRVARPVGEGRTAGSDLEPGGLLDDLERQLQDAEGRLARLSSGGGQN